MWELLGPTSSLANVVCSDTMFVGNVIARNHAPQWSVPTDFSEEGASPQPALKQAPIFLELFSGSGKLSAAMRKRGFSIFAVGHDFNQHRQHVSTISLNLQRESDQKVVLSMLDIAPVAQTHMGLPCGTCSRAREKALPHHLGSLIFIAPPLRDADNLLGFKSLTGSNKAKVDSANILYHFAILVLHKCFIRGIAISTENPERSWVWGILAKLIREHGDKEFKAWFDALERVSFHSCTHAGKRNKKTRILATRGLFSKLEAECDNSHEHQPWGIVRHHQGLRFDTASEAEYPSLLCKRMATALADFVNLPIDFARQVLSRQIRRRLGHVTNVAPLVSLFSTTRATFGDDRAR